MCIRDRGYPVLLRPSYVLGGQNMIIAHSDKDVEEYMAIITSHELENPVLIDKYLMGTEVEVDAISDGEDYLIPGIMEHIERAGVHSGDSISVYPAQTLSHHVRRTCLLYTSHPHRPREHQGFCLHHSRCQTPGRKSHLRDLPSLLCLRPH